MHKIKPNTRYKIVTVQLAVEENTDEGEFADEMSEMFNSNLISNDTNLADWRYTVHFENAPIVESSDDPEEGELF